MQLSSKYKKRMELEADIEWLKRQINLNRERIGLKATDYTKDNVQGTRGGNYTEDLIIKICDMERECDFMEKELSYLDECIEQYKTIAEMFGKEYLEIINLKEKGEPRYVIADKVGLSERTVQRRLKDLGLVEERN